MRIRCNKCGKQVSQEIPMADLVIRAFVECPECLEGVTRLQSPGQVQTRRSLDQLRMRGYYLAPFRSFWLCLDNQWCSQSFVKLKQIFDPTAFMRKRLTSVTPIDDAIQLCMGFQ